ncbi:MarR family winged helix-turn-helix transcriptional regulator [Nannocystis bainbridge]|uniref:MarR family transcriptional regulator n=1 Tax=Nannocystis bainbridge TaxID=2995303 RepID=A0ABT5DU16_9BACT|nr:MarR family transcriptional regulator [Nannocystis bainbridge]MDC0715907.1 MarR family transcriptional regulator [Nannocystis bainbridge]
MATTGSELRLRRLQSEAYLNLSRIHRELERKVADLLVESGLQDVTPAQLGVLIHLFQERAPQTARQLANLMGLSEVTVGRFVRALEGVGWVERTSDPTDSRAILVRPTRRAYAALPKLLEVSNALLDRAFAGFSPQEIEAIARTTEMVRDNLDPQA